MNPTVQTKGGDVSKFKAIRETIGRPHLGGSSETTVTHLKNNWGLYKYKAIGNRQLGGVGVEWKTTGKESGEHI